MRLELLENFLISLSFASICGLVIYKSSHPLDTVQVQTIEYRVLALFQAALVFTLAAKLATGIVDRFAVPIFSIQSAIAVFVLLASSLSGLTFSPMVIVAIANIYFIDSLRHQERSNGPPQSYFLGIQFASVVSLVIFLFIFFGGNFDFLPTYRFYRTDIGFIAGICLLSIFLSERPKKVLFSLPFLAHLSIAESRAAILSLFVSLVFYLFFALANLQRKHRALLIGVAVFGFMGIVVVFAIGERGVGFFEDTGLRWQIFTVVIEAIKERPLLGQGGYYHAVQLPNGSYIEAHNLVLQTILNFGILGLLAWVLWLGAFFLQVDFKGRAILVYFVVFGMFHPAMDGFNFTLLTSFTFLLVTRFFRRNSQA